MPREGIDLSVSTLADQVGACTTVLQPLHALIERHVLAAERLHGDDTTVPILAKGKTVTGHIWTYVRDDRPFGGRAPPAALYYASRDRRHEHPARHLHGFTGILQADAYSGYNELYDPLARARADHGGTVLGACAAAVLRAGRHRRQCPARQERGGDLADRAGGGQAHRRAVRHRARHQWPERRRASARPPGAERAACGRAGSLAARAALPPVALGLGRRADRLHARRWDRFARFLDDGRICLTNNAAERALRGFAVLESLCIPSSSVCKHWNRVVVSDATRATFSGHRIFDRLRRQVGGANLVWRAGHNLHRWQRAGFDQAAYCVACGA